jgi:hypothetical protein
MRGLSSVKARSVSPQLRLRPLASWVMRAGVWNRAKNCWQAEELERSAPRAIELQGREQAGRRIQVSQSVRCR